MSAMATSASTLATQVSADDPRLGAWRAFIHANARLQRRLDEELQATHGISSTPRIAGCG
jgi:hypothetical protein